MASSPCIGCLNVKKTEKYNMDIRKTGVTGNNNETRAQMRIDIFLSVVITSSVMTIEKTLEPDSPKNWSLSWPGECFASTQLLNDASLGYVAVSPIARVTTRDVGS